MPSPSSSRVRIVLVLVTLAGAVACVPSPESLRPTTTTTTVPRGDRHSRLEMGAAEAQQHIEFADARTGFALLDSYGPPRRTGAFRTDDGGRSWQRLPVDDGGHGFYTVIATTPSDVAFGFTDGFLVSRDGGRTFVTEKNYPAHMRSPLDRRASRRCGQQDDDGCLRYEVARAERSVPQQPPLRDDLEDAAEDAVGRIWAVAFAQDAVIAALSADQGSTWTAVPDLQLPYRVARVRLIDAREDGDLWLLVDGRDGELSAYLAQETSWRAVAGDLRPGFDTTHVASAGAGTLAVAGEEGFGYLGRDGTWRPVSELTAIRDLSRLVDGTLAVDPDGANTGLWIGAGQGAERTWAHVTVESF